ncbi:hypothetical protein CerSpe_268460 [Prunus speciosa]
MYGFGIFQIDRKLVKQTVTLAALKEVFQDARDIMSWLGDCAKVIASKNQPVRWTTTLGLHVVQPYCKTVAVLTLFQGRARGDDGGREMKAERREVMEAER